MIKETSYPSIAEKMYLGAFLVTPIWAFVHKKYIIALLSLIPIAGLIVSFMALIYGGKWAWDSKDWLSENEFSESRSKWNFGGLICSIIIITIFYFLK